LISLYLRDYWAFIKFHFLLFHPLKFENKLTDEALERLGELIEPWFIFSLIWSVGGSCNNDGREKFNEWLRAKIEKVKLDMPLPKQGLVYDYFLDDGGLFAASEEENKEEDDTNRKAKVVS
jgi:dynein heavy chain